MSKVIYNKNGHKVTEVYKGVELVEVIVDDVELEVTNNMDEYGHYHPNKQYINAFRNMGEYYTQDTQTKLCDTFHGNVTDIDTAINMIIGY